MMNHILGQLTPKAAVHMQMFTEFSGLGTPEFSMKALSAAAPAVLQVKVRSCCDWDTNCQTALVNNSDPDTHVFADIADVLTDEMKSRVQRKVLVEVPRNHFENILYVQVAGFRFFVKTYRHVWVLFFALDPQVNISKQDILRAIGSPDFMTGHIPDSDIDHGLPKEKPKCKMGVDDLFKRGATQRNFGLLKAKFLGNALKDYQLLRLSRGEIHGHSDKPCFTSYVKAKAAIQVPQLN